MGWQPAGLSLPLWLGWAVKLPLHVYWNMKLFFFCFLLCKFWAFRHGMGSDSICFCHGFLLLHVDQRSDGQRIKGACRGHSTEGNILTLMLLNLLEHRRLKFQNTSFFTLICIISKWQPLMHSSVRSQAWQAFRPKKPLPYLLWLKRVMWSFQFLYNANETKKAYK